MNDTIYEKIDYFTYKLKKDYSPEQYGKYLREVQTLVSNSGETDGRIRFEEHQEAAQMFIDACPVKESIILGFFDYQLSTEESRFDFYPEGTYERFEADNRQGSLELMIGYGPRDLATQVRARKDFDLSIDQDFGWKDAFGIHIEKYVASSREYIRESMTKRHYYTLKILENRVAVPQPIYKGHKITPQ
jgi:hypothetical protein